MRCDVASAEMIKLAANAALMTRISFINEIANVCEATGADVVKVAEGVGLDRRLGPHFLRAGIGYGGSCFPKDASALKQLAANSGYHFQLLNAVIEVNELQKRRVIGKLQQHLGALRGKRVALLGLAFKPNTDDMREAPSLVLAGAAARRGRRGRAWDPVADARELLHGVELAEPRSRRLRGADAAVIVTEWPELARARLGRAAATAMRTALIDRRPQPARPGRACAPPASCTRASAGRSPFDGSRERRADSELTAVEAARPRRAARPSGCGDAAQPAGRSRSSRSAGRPLAAYQVARLRRAGVTRVIVVACALGRERLFEEELSGYGPEIVAVGEPEPLGRGGGLRFAAAQRREPGPRLRAERRRAARRRLRAAPRAAPRDAAPRRRSSWRRCGPRSASSSSPTTT